MSKTLLLKVVTGLQDRLSGPLNKIRGAGGASAQSMKELRDKLKGLEQTQKDVGKFRSLSKGLSDTSEKMKAAQLRADELAAGIKNSANPTAKMRREFQQATRAAEDLKNKHGQQSQELQRLRSSLSSAGVSTKSLSKDERALRSDIAQTTSQLESQRKKLAQVAEQQRKLGEAREKMQRTQALAGSMATAGAAGLATGSGALYAGARFMSVGIEFDESMSRLQSLTRLDKDSDKLQALRDQAREKGAETMFSSTEVVAGQTFLGMAGFDADSILDATSGLLDMAKAGGNELAEAADIASNILTGFGLQASEMDRVGDTLVAAFTRSNVDLGMLGETMKYAAPIAASLGQDIETVTAMTGKLGDAGIQGGMAGTALRSIMNRLSAPPKSAAAAIEKLGLVTADAAGNLRPMPDILKDIYEKTQHMGDTERAGLMKAIAGEEAVSALQVLAQQAGSGELQTLIQILNEAEGEASRTAKIMADNLVGDLDQMKSAWEDLGIGIQEQQNGPMRELAQRVTKIIGAVSKWTQENPELVAKLVRLAAIIALLVAAGGALMVVLASILGPLAMMKYGMSMLAIKGGGLFSTLWGLGAKALPFVIGAVKSLTAALIANPIGAVIAAIAVAALLIWKYWEPIKEFFLGLWEQVKEAFDGGIAGITALIVNWSPLGLFYQVFASVMDYLGFELPSKFSEFGSMMMSGLVNGIKSMAGSVKDSVIGIGESTMGWFKDKLGIESPSRVFMGFGENISEGAAIGIDNKNKLALGAVKSLTAGVLAASASMPAFADEMFNAETLRFDDRPPITAQAVMGAATGQAQASQYQNNAGDNIEIHIHAAPGQNGVDIARAVAAELDRREREKRAQRRSSLHDY